MIQLFALGIFAAATLLGCGSNESLQEERECSEQLNRIKKNRKENESDSDSDSLKQTVAFPISDSNRPDIYFRSQKSGALTQRLPEEVNLFWRINRDICPDLNSYTQYPLQSLQESNGEILPDGRPGIKAGSSIRSITPLNENGLFWVECDSDDPTLKHTKIVDTKNETNYDWSLSETKEKIQKSLELKYGMSWYTDEIFVIGTFFQVMENKIWIPYRWGNSNSGIAEFDLKDSQKMRLVFDQETPGLFNFPSSKIETSFSGENEVILQYFERANDSKPTFYALIQKGTYPSVKWMDASPVSLLYYGEVSVRDEFTLLLSFIRQELVAFPPILVGDDQLLVVSQTRYTPFDLPSEEFPSEWGKITIDLFSPNSKSSKEFGLVSNNPGIETLFLVGDEKLLCIISSKKSQNPGKKTYQISTIFPKSLSLKETIVFEEDQEKSFLLKNNGETIVFDDFIFQFDLLSGSYKQENREETVVDIRPSYSKYQECQSLYGESHFKDKQIAKGESLFSKNSSIFNGLEFFLDEQRGFLWIDHALKTEAKWTLLPKRAEWGMSHPLNRSCYILQTNDTNQKRISCNEEVNRSSHSSYVHSNGKRVTFPYHNSLLTPMLR